MTDTSPAFLCDADQRAAPHHSWCQPGACSRDSENTVHSSLTSTVEVTNWPSPRQLQVRTQQFIYSDSSVGDDSRPTVYLQERGHDGYDLTSAEARQLAQALINHADFADGDRWQHPLDKAARLVVSSLAYTGRDPGEMHQAVLNVLDTVVDAMTEARRRR